MAVQDFTTYTENDPGSDLTVASAKITASDLLRSTDGTYVIKDFTAGYFNALNVNFEIYADSNSVDGGLAGIAISNTANETLDAMASTDLAVWYNQAASGDLYRLYIGIANTGTGQYVSISRDTLYYCTLTRAAGNNVATLKVYSDSGRTTQVGTDKTVSGLSTTTYRYAYGLAKWYDTAVPTASFYGYIQNLDFSPAPATSIKTVNGLAKASVKTVNGLAIASVKTINGLS